MTRPRKNVIIRLCSIECCFSHSIDKCGHDGHNAAAGHVSNPVFDVEKGTEEFIAAYCGAGAEPVLRYVNALNHRAEEIQSHRTCYAYPDREFFSPEFMAFARDCFDEAKRNAENADVLERIQRWEMSIRYVDMFLYHDKYDDAQLEEEKERFLGDMVRLGISHINEGTCGENNRRMIEDYFRSVRPKKEA